VTGEILSDEITFLYNETEQLSSFMSFTRSHSRPFLSFGATQTTPMKNIVKYSKTPSLLSFPVIGSNYNAILWMLFVAILKQTHFWRDS